MKTTRYILSGNKVGGKQSLRLFITGIIIIALPFFPNAFGQSLSSETEHGLKSASMPTEKGLIMSVREIRLKADVDPAEFEKWITAYWNPEWQNLIPGLQSFVSKGNSKKEGSIYVYCLIFNSKKIHQSTLDKADSDTEWYPELIYYEPTKHLYDELFEHIEINPFFNNKTWFEIK